MAPTLSPIVRLFKPTLGPYARRGKSELALVWSEQEGRHASIVAKRAQLRKDSSIEGDTKPFELGVATSVDQLLLAAFHGDFLAVWSDAKTRGATLYARTLRVDDEALPIATIKDEILWLECIELGKGAAVVWVERSMTSGLGDVKAIVLGKDGRPRTGAAVLASGVTAWQVAKIGDNRLGLASLRPLGEQEERGQIVWSQFVDDLAKATEQNVGIGTGELDVHVESMADAKGEAHVEIGYSSHRGLDRTAMMARVTRAGDGNTPAPVPLVTSGARRFLSFTSSGASLLRDEEAGTDGAIRVARRIDGRTRESELLRFTGEPEKSKSTSSDWMLGTMVCPKSDTTVPRGADPCASGNLTGNVVVRSSRTELGITALRIDGRTFDRAWNLECYNDECGALASRKDERSGASDDVYWVDLVKVSEGPATARLAQDVARPVLETFWEGGAVAAFDLTEISRGSTFMGWIETLGNSANSLQAGGKLHVARIGDRASRELVSSRALPQGGVSFASTPNEIMMAWVANEGGDPQVHITKFDPQGKKQGDLLMTSEKGDAHSVNIAWVEDGYVVSWIDGRDGNGEVYLAKVSKNLKMLLPHTRVTRSEGSATELVMRVAKKKVVLAWIEPRTRNGFPAPLMASFGAKDLVPSVAEVAFGSAERTTRSIGLARVNDETWALAVVDEGSEGDVKGSVVLLNNELALQSQRRVKDEGLPAASIAVDVREGGTRVLTTHPEEVLRIRSSFLRSEEPPKEIGALFGPPGQPFVHRFYRGDLFYAERSPAQGRTEDDFGRIRRIKLEAKSD